MVCNQMARTVKALPKDVLILILLEYGLQQDLAALQCKPCTRLNPYSTGIWSATLLSQLRDLKGLCLNPYSTGIWSATDLSKAELITLGKVLILILLEYGLQPTL